MKDITITTGMGTITMRIRLGLRYIKSKNRKAKETIVPSPFIMLSEFCKILRLPARMQRQAVDNKRDKGFHPG